jgi:hypothetical protein
MRLITLALFCWLCLGCGDARSVGVVPAAKAPDAPLSDDIDGLRQELRDLEQRKRIVQDALDQARLESVQTKLWLASGTFTFAGLVLIALGVWTTRRILVSAGVAALGAAGLCVVAVHLVPYLLWIGLAVLAGVIAFTVWMLRNRETALTQVSAAVDEAKARLPEFRDKYRDIFRANIDTSADHVLNSIRGVKG